MVGCGEKRKYFVSHDGGGKVFDSLSDLKKYKFNNVA
jgi:hypothetical protein